MKRTYETKVVKVSSNQKSVRCNIPADIRDLLKLKPRDTVQFNVHYMNDDKIIITFNKKNE